MPCPDCSDNADYERVELVWPGKGKPVERVSLPFQTIERVNDVRRSRSAQAELVGAATRHSGTEQNQDTQDMPRHSRVVRAVHRDENDEERSSSALKAHTLCQRDRRLVNPEGWCRVSHSTSSPVHNYPLKV